MSLTSINLDAFLAVVRAQSFSKAAKAQYITQSALSQRVAKLEAELEGSLFIRDRKGLILTDMGKSLLQYCQQKEALEENFRMQIHESTSSHGNIRIGGYSSINQSVIIPLLAQLAKKKPNTKIELQSLELHSSAKALHSAQVDFIFVNEPLRKENVYDLLIGYESNVMIEPIKSVGNEHIYLDHDSEDRTTIDFLTKNSALNKKTIIQRSYYDEIYSIIRAVELGLGRAVVPLHLIAKNKEIRILNQYKELKTPVYLSYYKQPYYTDAQNAFIESIKTEFRKQISTLLSPA
ncbi:MAG: LysR family transcriptional regulator [Oligoflexia bacterium]|nr:LysR family transcriptional regulator [Oligoflexia bacterium]